MQSVSGFSPAPQAVGMPARAFVANKSQNLFAASHTDSFQASLPAAKFAGLLLKKDTAALQGAERKKAILSEDKPDSNLVANPRNGKVNKATGWQLTEITKIRKDQDLSDVQKIKKIGEVFRKTFVAMQKRNKSS